MDITVSVIMPSLNVADYIEESINSALNQTLEQMEIICIDAGSEDGTWEILKKYENLPDSGKKVRLIHSDIKSYGYQVNLGIKQAAGKYIAILETDDMAEEHMYEYLLAVAEEHDLDFIKADYDCFHTLQNGERHYEKISLWQGEPNRYNLVLDPGNDDYLYSCDYSIWAGIFNRDFLLRNNIWLNETKGAAYQDIGFAQQVLACAKRAYYSDQSFYRYRRDREGSSINSVYGLKYARQEFTRLLSDSEIHKKLICAQGLYRHMATSFVGEYQKILALINYDTDSDYVRDDYEWFRTTLVQAVEQSEFDLDKLSEGFRGGLLYILRDCRKFAEEFREQEKKRKKEEKSLMSHRKREEIIENLSKALIGWYDFRADSKILFVSGGRPECETLYDVLEEKGLRPEKADIVGLGGIRDRFDYVVAAGIIERSSNPMRLLTELRGMLKTSGKLLVGAENRMAVRYFCGERDPFSGHVFDGPEGYANVSGQRRNRNGGRTYSKAEYEKMLSGAGFQKYRFYAVMPDLARPQILLAEDYIPNETLDMRVFPQYDSPGTVFLKEELLYGTLMENHMFHQMANAFFMECAVDGTLSDIDQITVQGDRARDGAMATLIKDQKWVVKKALYPEGRERIRALSENAAYLKRHEVPMAEGKLEGDTYVMPYIEGQIATDYFREMLRKDKQEFIRELGRFRQIILDSSEHVPYEEVNWREFEPRWENRKKDDPNLNQWYDRAFGPVEERENIGVILKRGYIDLVCLNCFHTDKGFVFFDQEFYIENFPINTIFNRTIDLIYEGAPDLERICPRGEVMKHFKVLEHLSTWREMSNVFMEKLRNEKALSEYHRLHRRDCRTMSANRHRMDYSQEEYGRLFTNIFKGTENRQVWLFGSGKYAEKFMGQFGQYCDIAGIVDNNEERWGKSLAGVEIHSPDILKELNIPFKVIVCIMLFEDVTAQLDRMGIRNVSVYDPLLDYEKPIHPVRKEEYAGAKKYHIGYVAGVFDLFHMGHLNLLRRAKEQCDYLIAGVVSDEQVISAKKTRPYIPFEERLAIVQACRYVDEAVAIPIDRPDTQDAWYMYHFDVQFSGSDYEKDPFWLSKRAFLQQHGSDLVFFPYTEGVSSTQLKEQISSNISM